MWTLTEWEGRPGAYRKTAVWSRPGQCGSATLMALLPDCVVRIIHEYGDYRGRILEHIKPRVYATLRPFEQDFMANILDHMDRSCVGICRIGRAKSGRRTYIIEYAAFGGDTRARVYDRGQRVLRHEHIDLDRDWCWIGLA